jgi:hypothetical protein
VKTLKRLRYYCDYCKKAGGQKSAMQKHEAGCTLNPARECKMCALREVEQPSIESLIAAAGAGLNELYRVAGGCPACMLAGIRQCRKKYPAYWDGDAYEPNGVHQSCNEWRYKAAIAQFWENQNDTGE